MKEFRTLLESKHLASGSSWSLFLDYEAVQFKYITVVTHGIAAGSLATYLKLNLKAGDSAVNLADVSSMRRADSGTGTIIVIDFPLAGGLEVKVLPVNADFDITIYGSNT